MDKSRALGLGALVLALSAALAAPAMARDHDRGRGHDRGGNDRAWHVDRGRRGWDDRHERRDDRRDRRHDRRDDRRHAYRYDRPVRVVHHRPSRVVYHVPAHRPGPPRWARGRVYHHYGYAPTYVVHDYRPYGLRAPPRGHYWRRSDAGDFLLVAAATGIIADLILHGGH
jgi:Ni/Co efflux regulator RcnB